MEHYIIYIVLHDMNLGENDKNTLYKGRRCDHHHFPCQKQRLCQPSTRHPHGMMIREANRISKHLWIHSKFRFGGIVENLIFRSRQKLYQEILYNIYKWSWDFKSWSSTTCHGSRGNNVVPMTEVGFKRIIYDIPTPQVLGPQSAVGGFMLLHFLYSVMSPLLAWWQLTSIILAPVVKWMEIEWPFEKSFK